MRLTSLAEKVSLVRVMANRVYLQCLQGISNCELVAKYSLPDGWYDFFGPNEFHTGNECPIPDVCKPHTTSYFLAEARVVVDRFAKRMERAKIPLEGDGATAQLYAWLKKHFREGWIFADTTELEWMSDSFVSSTRSQLAMAEKRKKRTALTPKTLLFDIGWGTGLSPEEMAEELQRARNNPQDVSKLEGRPYQMGDTYAVGEVVAHRIFGSGTVQSVTESKVTIAFALGLKTLAHRKVE